MGQSTKRSVSTSQRLSSNKQQAGKSLPDLVNMCTFLPPALCCLPTTRAKCQMLPPASPCYAFPRGKCHTRGDTWASLRADSCEFRDPRGRGGALPCALSLHTCLSAMLAEQCASPYLRCGCYRLRPRKKLNVFKKHALKF